MSTTKIVREIVGGEWLTKYETDETPTGGGAQATIMANGNDQWPELQAALSGVDEGASVEVLAADEPVITTRTLEISRALTLRGESMSPLYGPIFGSGDGHIDAQVMPTTAPFLKGSVINMRTAATDAFLISAVGAAVNVRDLGVVFGESGDEIILQDTGNAFTCRPPIHSSTYREQGIMGAKWSNVASFGHDGSHRMLDVINGELCNFFGLQSFGGLFFNGQSNGPPPENGQYGNFKFWAPYILNCVGGVGHVVDSGYTKPAGQDFILNRWFAPHVWHWSLQGDIAGKAHGSLPAPEPDTQLMWADGAPVFYDAIYEPDWETAFGGHSRIRTNAAVIGGLLSADSIDFGSGLYGSNGSFWVPSGGKGIPTVTYQPGTIGVLDVATADATAAAGANAGTTPPAPVVDGTTSRGNVTWGSGSTPAAGAQVAITYGVADLYQVPRVTLTPRNPATFDLGLIVTGTAKTGFTISTKNAPTASQANTVYSADWVAIA